LCLDGLLRPIISSAGWLLVIQLFEKNQQFIFIFADYENKVVAYFHFSVILISYGEEKDFRKIH